ncbi:unnamed protein product [Trichogramma brassicae]|uniref:Uncharacterized protein n=1 Tax=Trichogramma brassicae TaxID=86971 RepID=A0A6H5J5D3_9HYME|nr:unnamed protein product [Trichogramma brassicae]
MTSVRLHNGVAAGESIGRPQKPRAAAGRRPQTVLFCELALRIESDCMYVSPHRGPRTRRFLCKYWTPTACHLCHCLRLRPPADCENEPCPPQLRSTCYHDKTWTANVDRLRPLAATPAGDARA